MQRSAMRRFISLSFLVGPVSRFLQRILHVGVSLQLIQHSPEALFHRGKNIRPGAIRLGGDASGWFGGGTFGRSWLLVPCLTEQALPQFGVPVNHLLQRLLQGLLGRLNIRFCRRSPRRGRSALDGGGWRRVLRVMRQDRPRRRDLTARPGGRGCRVLDGDRRQPGRR